MKKLLIILTLGLMFGEVSQRIVELNTQSGEQISISELLPELTSDWVIISIVECNDSSNGEVCYFNQWGTSENQPYFENSQWKSWY